jgi:hypothetical protein
MMQKLWSKLKAWFLDLVRDPALAIYLVAVVIYLPWFFPNLSDIAPWDETYYLISGKQLLAGQPPTLAYGPLLSFFYSLCYLPFRGSPFWLIHANSLGRFFLFTFVFIGAAAVGRAMKRYFHPLLLLGFLFLHPLLVENFEYPADLLFAAISALAFARAVRFLHTRELKHIWWAAFWLGMGMLTRGDALILFAALLVFVVVMGRKTHAWWRLLLAMVVPFVALSGGYVLLRGAITGDFDTGMAARAYTAFEQGQEVDMPAADQRFGAPTASYYVARERFGAPEENALSVLRAISRNPEAYFNRLKAVVKLLPGLFLTAYYRRFTILIAFLALRGLIVLIRQKKLPLALLHLLWLLPLSAGIARTLVRVGYFRLFFFVMFSLAIIGLKALLDNLRHGWEGILWGVGMAVVLILSFPLEELGIQLGMTVFLCWLFLAALLARRDEPLLNWRIMAMLLLLAGAFLLKGSFRIYRPRVLGKDPREAASLVLREVTDPGDIVLTGTPSVVFLAEREVANFYGQDIPEFPTSDAFIDWMASQDFDAIYLDLEAPARLWDLSFAQAGNWLTLVYGDEADQVYIFLLDSVYEPEM